MAKIIQGSFSRGEIAPALFGRVDTRIYQLGLKTARNVIIHQFGSVSSRPGTMFIGPAKYHNRRCRLVEFQFKTTDTHILEFGHEYVRFIRNDSHITEDAVNISNVTQADPAVVTTSTSHGYSTGDEVFLSAVGGMTEITERRWKITVLSSTTFSLQDQVTGDDVDSTGFTAYTSGGTSAKFHEVVTPYQESELRDLKFVQTADVVTIVHPSHSPRELRRLGLNNWELATIVFEPEIDFPTSVAASGGSGSAAEYTVTAISEQDEESLAGLSGTASNITAITKADPAVVTISSHPFNDGDRIYIQNVGGMTELNGRQFTVTGSTTNTFELLGEDSTDYGTYTSGGTATPTFIAHSADTGVTISWSAVSDAIRYRVFKKDNGVFGFIGSTEGLSFTDSGSITPDSADTPPRQFLPFLGTDNYPGAVGFHQQRRVFGGSNNEPDTNHFSVVGVYDNFSHSIPFGSDDAFSTTLASREVNQIRHYVSLSDLLVFTSGSEWSITNQDGAGFAIDTISQRPQSNWGSSQLPPLVVGSTALFVEESATSVRSVKFSFDIDAYNTSDLSILVPHLFRGYSLVEWAYSRRPDPIIYMVRNDGELLTLTFNEEQEVIAWSHWDGFGLYESVAVIRPSITDTYDAAYLAVKRTIDGNTVRYIERTTDRVFEDVRDCFFVDSGLSLDNPYDIEDITNADPGVITITGHPFNDGDLVDIFDTEWVVVYDNQGNAFQPGHLNGYRFEVDNATSNTFTLKSIEDGSAIDTSDFAAYVGGGTVRKAVTFISGMWHLANTPVSILADGNVISNLTIASNGTLTLPRAFSRVHIGLPYTCDIETVDPEPDPDTTIQGRLKKVDYVDIKVNKSRGMWVGPSFLNLQEWKQRENEAYGEPTNLFTGTARVNVRPDWNSHGRVAIRQLDPLPLTVLAIIPEIEVGEDR